MTDEERKKLVAELRDPSVYYVTGTCLAAAAEIERLAKENGRLTQALIDKLAAYSAKG
jgi:HAMP domain-containing protein